MRMQLHRSVGPIQAPARHRLRRAVAGLRPRARGQALVEFALVLPVMVVLLLTVIDLGRLFYSQMAITNAAREGAMQASLPASPTSGGPGGTFDPNHAWDTGTNPQCLSATDAVTCRTLLEFQGTPANWFVQPAPSDVTAHCVGSAGTPPCPSDMGNEAAVTVQTTFSLWSPWMGAFFGGHQTIELSATATSQVQTMPTGAAQIPVTPNTGSILISKSAVGGTGTFRFTGEGSGLPASFNIITTASDSSSTTSAGSALFTNLSPGTYRVEEGSASGWAFTSLVCVTSGSGGSTGTQNGTTATQADITLQAGDAVICTFTSTLSTTCQAPSAGFTAGTSSGSAASGSGVVLTVTSGTSVTFTDTSTPNPPCTSTTWQWTIASGNGNGNSTTLTGQGPQMQTFTSQNSQQAKSYTVTLTVANSSGSSNATMTVTATP